MSFVDVTNVNGEIQRVPEAWLEPGHRFAEQFTRVDEEAKVAEYEAETIPNETWTMQRLRDFATDSGVEITGLRSKADVLSAIVKSGDTPDDTDAPEGEIGEAQNG